MSTRRKFFKSTVAAGIAAMTVPHKLQAAGQEKKRLLRIAHITDIHMTDALNAITCTSRVFKEINAMKDKPDLIVNTGDTVMDENKQTRERVEILWDTWNNVTRESNKIRMISALGNHDVWYGPDASTDAEYKRDPRYGKQWAIEVLSLPARYYSVTVNGWQFIALDSIQGENGYQLDDEQFGWLRNELAKLGGRRPVCVLSHVPIVSVGAWMYETKRTKALESKFPSADMHLDHQRLKDLFQEHKNVKLCLSGHVHYVDNIEYLGVKYLCNGAVSGNWWRDPLKLDEFPPVYAIIDLYDDGTSVEKIIQYDSAV
ncbi:MAG TPA: metallophosphoesterase [Cyclobacteriaceae bacterium]|nr:metallophosphoesterase [Cyclobacteriaceae bacterium]